MSGCPPRQFCPACRQEMIHRDHRKPWESSSALGQVLWNRGPRMIGVADCDAWVHKRWSESKHGQVLRLIEKKEERQSLGSSQEEILSLVHKILRHAVAAGVERLTADTGVYIMQGRVEGTSTGKRRTEFTGPQIVTPFENGASCTFTSEEEFFHWLDPDCRFRRVNGR